MSTTFRNDGKLKSRIHLDVKFGEKCSEKKVFLEKRKGEEKGHKLLKI